MSFFKKLFGLESAPQPETKPAPSAAPAPTAQPAAEPAAPKADSAQINQVAQKVVDALGGVANIKEVKACAATRLRMKVASSSSIDEAAVRAAGANGVMVLSEDLIHVLIGLEADQYALAVERLRA